MVEEDGIDSDLALSPPPPAALPPLCMPDTPTGGTTVEKEVEEGSGVNDQLIGNIQISEAE